jgi:hypothetical protein
MKELIRKLMDRSFKKGSKFDTSYIEYRLEESFITNNSIKFTFVDKNVFEDVGLGKTVCLGVRSLCVDKLDDPVAEIECEFKLRIIQMCLNHERFTTTDNLPEAKPNQWVINGITGDVKYRIIGTSPALKIYCGDFIYMDNVNVYRSRYAHEPLTGDSFLYILKNNGDGVINTPKQNNTKMLV